MKKILVMSLSILFILSSIVGMGCSVWGIQSLDGLREDAKKNFGEGLMLVLETLDTTNDGLMIVQDTLIKARENTIIISSMVLEVSTTIKTTRETTESLGEFFTDDLTEIVTETQDSLLAAQASASLVDDTLKIISSIPLIGAKYAPTKPLGESIADVSNSLNSLPSSFNEIDQDIENTGNSLYDIELSIIELSETITEIDSTMEDAQVVIENYQEITSELEKRVITIQEKIPFWVNTLHKISFIFLAWTIIVSLSMLSQAFILIKAQEEK